MMLSSQRKRVFATLCAALLAGCASTGNEVIATRDAPTAPVAGHRLLWAAGPGGILGTAPRPA
jgi:type IV pilus biogenesis protein CpaD/CtpE